ncbi:IRR1 [Candida margitis]|uniref:IRR1 n=1 Tax=Candida margitis TaxID=1775924 RepID=UPI002227096A|nr:IRR1 [Candida margitis]KAI5967533.1 IRR1 [Candida margitis]
MSTTRRSTRNNKRPVHYDESSDVEEDNEAYVPSEEQDKENVLNHVTKSTKRRATTNATTTSANTSKRQRISGRSNHQQTHQGSNTKSKKNRKGKNKQPQLEDDWEENYLYQALSSPEINILDLAQEWIETYEEESASANTDSTSVTLLINLILRSCGSFHLFQPHDLTNLESASSTVEEITLAFGNQSTHKFPFKLVPVFKKNVLQFFQHIIEICHEKGLLYPSYTEANADDGGSSSSQSQLMSYLITWATNLCGSAVRSLRFTSTEISLAMQLELSKIGKSITTNLDRSRKHLYKLTDERSTKYKTIKSTIDNYESQLNTLNEYFDEITSTVVSQRYKDSDPQIRLGVVKYLIDTMISYPSYFCQSQFLKYFGWLLSDPINQVRNEITRDLLKLYKLNKNQDIVDGLAQFSAKFQPQFVAMCSVDADTNVRAHCCGILTEMIKMGFLNGDNKHSVIKAFPFESSTKLKLQNEFVKFIQVATEEKVKQVLEKNQLLFDQNTFVLRDHDVRDILSIKVLAQELSFLVEQEQPLEVIFESIAMSSVYSTKLGCFLDYLLTDIAELRDKNADNDDDDLNSDLDQVKQLIQLDDFEKQTLLEAIHGIIKATLRKKSSKQGGGRRGEEEEEETKSAIITQFIDYIPKLQTFCSKSNNRYKIFISIWQDLIDDKHNCIFNYYIKLDKIDQYEDVIHSILQYYYEFSLVNEFAIFFEKLFNSRGLTESIKFEIQRIVNELVGSTIVYLRDSHEEEQEGDINLHNSNEEVDMDHDFVLWTNRQKHVIKLCRETSILVSKIKLISHYVNIANLEQIDDLIYQFNNRILNKFDLNVVLNQWKHNFILQLPQFSQAFISIVELVFIIVGWKFEKLIDVPNQQQQHIDIELELEMVGDVVSNLIRYIDETKDMTIAEHNQEDLTKLIGFKCQVTYQYINLIISFRLFYTKFHDDNNFSHFKSYFRSNKYVISIKPDLQMELLEMFLIKEVKLASALEIELDRDDEEGVHYEEYVDVQMGANEEATAFSEDGDDDDDDEEERRIRREKQQRLFKAKEEQMKQDKIWQLEKDLSVYALKLISLKKLQLISNDIYQRLKKNAGKLGEVYYKLTEQEKDVENRTADGDIPRGHQIMDLDVDVETAGGENEGEGEGEGEDRSINATNIDNTADVSNEQEQDVSMNLQLELDV